MTMKSIARSYGGEFLARRPTWDMTPLAQFVGALLESTAPVTQILDDIDLAPDPLEPDDMQALLGNVLAPLAALFEPRDLLVATAVLEAASPILAETLMLVPLANGRHL